MRNSKLRFFLPVVLLVLLSPILTEASADTGILRATLTNGLRVVIVRNTLAPVVTTQVNYLVGSNEAPEGFPGMAHAQEHMMFRGSPGLSAAQLSNIMALMGGDFNASHHADRHPVYFHRAEGRSRCGAEHRGGAHAGRPRYTRPLGAGAGSDRTGGGPGSFESRVHLLLAAPRGNVPGYALCP